MRRIIHQGNRAERIADTVTSAMGSWWFIGIQTSVIVVWIALNIIILTHPWDPYPLILLNLLFSVQAAYSSPLILMSQNRQAKKDRVRDDVEAQEVESIFKSHDLLVEINKKQLEILEAIKDDG